MSQSRAVIISLEDDEHLSFIFELAEGFRMHDTIAVALIARAPFMLGFIILTLPGILGLHGISR
jgi:hypothetical protein